MKEVVRSKRSHCRAIHRHHESIEPDAIRFSAKLGHVILFYSNRFGHRHWITTFLLQQDDQATRVASGSEQALSHSHPQCQPPNGCRIHHQLAFPGYGMPGLQYPMLRLPIGSESAKDDIMHYRVVCFKKYLHTAPKARIQRVYEAYVTFCMPQSLRYRASLLHTFLNYSREVFSVIWHVLGRRPQSSQ